jgi:hypothetical protein
MKFKRMRIKFPNSLIEDKEDIMISFFQTAIRGSGKQTRKISRTIDRLPAIGSQMSDIKNLAKTVMSKAELEARHSDKFFMLEKDEDKEYSFYYPDTDVLRSMGVVKIQNPNTALIKHVFLSEVLPRMGFSKKDVSVEVESCERALKS